MKKLHFILLILALCLFCQYESKGQKWNPTRDVIPGFKGWLGNPDSLKVFIDSAWSDADKAKIRNGMKKWNDSGGKPKFKEVGSPPADITVKKEPAASKDEGTWTPKLDPATGKRTGGTITLKEAPTTPGLGLEEVAIHEFGHALGLDDTTPAANPSDVMKASGANGTGGNLSDHDKTEMGAALKISEKVETDKKKAETPEMAIMPGQEAVLEFVLSEPIPTGSLVSVEAIADPYLQVLGTTTMGNILNVMVFTLPPHGAGTIYLDVNIFPPAAPPIEFIGIHYVNPIPVPHISFECPFIITESDGLVHIKWEGMHTYPFSGPLRSRLVVDSYSQYENKPVGNYDITLEPGTHFFELYLDDYQVNSAYSSMVYFVTGQSVATEIYPGDDLWTVPCGGIKFGPDGDYPTLPADFFGPGSEPFTGTISLEGSHSNGSKQPLSDVIVNRPVSAILPEPYPSMATIPTEITQLQLKSGQPVKITRAGGYPAESFFDVFFEINLGAPKMGMDNLIMDNPHGGTFGQEFSFYPVITFVEVSKSTNQYVFDPYNLGYNQLTYSPTTSYDWTLSPIKGEFDPIGNIPLELHTIAGTTISLVPLLVRNDNFTVEINGQGTPVNWQGSGFNSGEWYNYPNFNWYNVWFYDHPFAPDRIKIITGNMIVMPRDPQQPSYVEIIYNWSTSLWPGYPEMDVPPLPQYVQDPNYELSVIGRSEPIFTWQGAIVNPIVVTVPFNITQYNPEWLSVDIRGYNYILQGTLQHTCWKETSCGSVDLDYGDAPDPLYPTFFANDGARHVLNPSVYLGNLIDVEPDGQPNATANGDDIANLDDEDGITFIKPFIAGKPTVIKVKASVAGFLNGWLDFNKNGSWVDASDQIFANQPLIPGINTLTINVPPGASPGFTYSRFRFNTTGGLTYKGLASDGEVEDYKITIFPQNWGYIQTNSTHLISVPANIQVGCVTLLPGDFIGAFYTNESGNMACGGATSWDGVNNQVVVAFGDDFTTPAVKEGFSENENFLWKVFHSNTGLEEVVEVGYDILLPNSDGKFHSNGLSAIIYISNNFDVTVTATPATICQGDVVQLFALVNGGCPPYLYSWTSVPAGFTSNLQNPTDTPQVTTTYYVTVTNGNGGTKTASVMVTVLPLPQVQCPPLMWTCEGEPPVLLNTATPLGGVYTGTGVFFDGVNYWFNPAVGHGVYAIAYCYTDPDTGCSNCCTFPFFVYALPVVNCPNDFSVCVNDPPFVLTGATPPGGIYSGTGVSGGKFYPSVAGVGVHTITYTYTDPQTGCTNSCTFTITVKALPNVTCPQSFSLCVNDPPYTLTGGTPVGGTYSGPGVSGGKFYPSVAGVGVHTITYTYTDPQTGCTNSCTFTITVKALPNVTCPQSFSLCVNDPPYTLTGGTPVGGTYSGTGVSGGKFYPSVAGVGVHTITYTYTDPQTGCTNSCTFTITVKALPNVTCPQSFSLCVNDPPYTLTGGTPVGGTYSGTGVSGGKFYPATAGVGVHTITYTYTDPQTGCTNSCTFTITVNALPNVICPPDFSLCLNDPPFTLTGATPVGGTYSGTGVSGGKFYPSVAGVGVHTITYTYTDPQTGCTNSCTFTITVKALPNVTCPQSFSLCVNDPPYTLTGGTPVGGTYSGTGVSGGKFYPSVAGVGVHTITYTYTDPQTGCTNSCTFTITVKALPNVTCPQSFSLCENDPPFTLTGATPVGGTYSGTGVSGGKFYPAVAGVGVHTITYTYTDPQTGCTNSCTFTITVNALPNVICPPDFSLCLNDPPFTLTGATPVGGTYSGTGVSGGKFYPATAGIGNHIITYTYSEPATGCSNSCTFVITVKPLPELYCPPKMEACYNDPPVKLDQAIPLGGIYGGPGVYYANPDYWFNPNIGAGTYILTYCYTDQSGCTNCCEFPMIVYPKPDVTCPQSFTLCVTDPPYTLSGGFPSGGIYSGTGVSGGKFYPSVAGVGVHIITYTYTNPQTGCSNSCTFAITVNVGHLIPIESGWSGVSSYVIPNNPDIINVMNPVFEQLILIYNFDGVYWPEKEINTLGNWDTYSGYVIKVNEDAILPICGNEATNKTVNLNQGWNLIPVLSSGAVDITTLFAGVNGFQIAKDVAGIGVYWPAYNINTIGNVNPGKAYFVRMSVPGFIDYSLPPILPYNMSHSGITPVDNPWNPVTYSPGSHLAAFNVASGVFEIGDVIGGFTADGLCAGVINVTDKSRPFALNLNGDDITTPETDGFAAGEVFSYKLYRPATGELFNLEATYNPGMNAGNFEANGLSEITTVKMLATGISQQQAGHLKIYPNPTLGIFTIAGFDQSANITILNAFGEEMLKNEMILPAKLDFSNRPKGVYLIKVEVGNSVFFEKLILN